MSSPREPLSPADLDALEQRVDYISTQWRHQLPIGVSPVVDDALVAIRQLRAEHSTLCQQAEEMQSELGKSRDENARLTKELEHERHEKETVRDAGAAHIQWLREKRAAALSTLEGQIRELRDYVQHRDDCRSHYCRTCIYRCDSATTQSHMHIPRDCTCGLSALIRSRETIPHPQGDGEASS